MFSQVDPLLQSDAPGDATPWFAVPRNYVLLVLVLIVVIGGGRRLLLAARARRVVNRLGESGITPLEIEEAGQHGRAGLFDLFRLLEEAPQADQRQAAGRALAQIWAADDLITEEEQAIVRRGYHVDWTARRRYPRSISAELPIRVTYGVPFLRANPSGVSEDDLEWSHRLAGTQRAALEEWSPWRSGTGQVLFQINPIDFASNGPHRLQLWTRVRTRSSLTSRWEFELPATSYPFEFDDQLRLDALLGSFDDVKDGQLKKLVRLVQDSETHETARFLDLNAQFVIRQPPLILIDRPLPSDLSHRLFIEIDGLPDRYEVGTLTLVASHPDSTDEAFQQRLDRVSGLTESAIDRPGERQIRVRLEPDANLAWASPKVRSLWPGVIETNWQSVTVIRR